MREQNTVHAIAELTEAVAVQTELANQRLALEWGQTVFSRLLQVWLQLEAHEALAYEDKVAAQVRVLDEATSSLWHLHKLLARTGRLLRGHRQHLKQLKDPLGQ